MKWQKQIVGIVAAIFLAVYVVLWLVIDARLVFFRATSGHPALVLSDAVVTTAGFLSTTVATGSASVLGFTIAAVPPAAVTENRSMIATVNTAVGSGLLFWGILAYLAVGVITLAAWLVRATVAPDLTKTFALSVVGWAGGAFGAVFKAPAAPAT